MSSFVQKGKRSGSASAFLRPAMDRDNLHVLVKAHVTRVRDHSVLSTFVISSLLSGIFLRCMFFFFPWGLYYCMKLNLILHGRFQVLKL